MALDNKEAINRAKKNAQGRDYYHAHREALSAKRRTKEYRAYVRELRLKNPEHYNAWQREWRRNNPDKTREIDRRIRPGIIKRQKEKRDTNAEQGLCRCGKVREDEQFRTCRICRDKGRAYHQKTGNHKQRERYLHTVKGVFRVQKRKYPEDGKCELNGESGRRLAYHHWLCHRFVEAIDQGWHLSLLGKYLRLKEEINNGK